MQRILPNRCSFLFALLVSVPAAHAAVGNIPAYPPDGWDKLCSGGTIQVKASVNRRDYSGGGSCWVNGADDKTNADAQKWARVNVSFTGFFDIQSGAFSESLEISTPPKRQSEFGNTYNVVTKGSCPDDPWATGAQCSSSPPSVNLGNTFGWFINPPPGPLSRNVFNASYVAGMLAKQMSKPPLAPVDLDAVRWPASDNKGNVGRVFFRVPDVSDNKWIMRFDIEQSMNSPNSAFTKVGEMPGPGARSQLAAWEVDKMFWTPNKIGDGAYYYYRVCSVNDTGRSCTAAMKAREPSQMELLAVKRSAPVVPGIKPGGGTNVPASASAPGGSAASVFGSKRPSSTGSSANVAGGAPAGTTATVSAPAAASVFGGKRPALAAGGGAPAAARPGEPPDLAVASEGMTIHDRGVPWNATQHLDLSADAAQTCHAPVSFRYANLGKGPAAGVMAEIFDSQQPGRAIATGNSASLAPGQSASVNGVVNLKSGPAPVKLNLSVNVHETGGTHELNPSNNRGTITLEVLCRPGTAIAPAMGSPTTSVTPSAPIGGVHKGTVLGR